MSCFHPDSQPLLHRLALLLSPVILFQIYFHICPTYAVVHFELSDYLASYWAVNGAYVQALKLTISSLLSNDDRLSVYHCTKPSR